MHILHIHINNLIKKALSYQHAFSTVNANLNTGNSPMQIKKKKITKLRVLNNAPTVSTTLHF